MPQAGREGVVYLANFVEGVVVGAVAGVTTVATEAEIVILTSGTGAIRHTVMSAVGSASGIGVTGTATAFEVAAHPPVADRLLVGTFAISEMHH